jgi:N-acetylglucosamine-6-phosphate deacetylase
MPLKSSHLILNLASIHAGNAGNTPYCGTDTIGEMITTVAADYLVTAESIIEKPLVAFAEGSIVSISSRDADKSTQATYDFNDATLTPGLFDIHMHGAVGCDVMDGTTDSLTVIGDFLARHGVTDYLATTVTASNDFTLRAVDAIAAKIESGPGDHQATIRGIHMEGPFLSHAKRGMHPAEHLISPTPRLLNAFWEASRGKILLMTIAPEVPGAIETMARAAELGIRCSMGHSNASTAEALAGLHVGAVSATHTFNAMRRLDHRDPGILGVVLDRDDLYSDLICDGVHVAPEIVRLWLKAKGPDRAILITDALQAAGMPNGVYRLGETRVHVQDGRCVTDNGVLAGSVLTLDEAVRRMRAFTGADLATAIRLAWRNPHRMLGLQEEFGVGSDATINVFSDDCNLRATILRGKVLQ